MSFPRTEKYRRVEATIYGKSVNYPLYRVAYYADGKRHMKSFATYGGPDGAKKWAYDKVRQLHKGSKLASLTPGQAADALAAFQRLQTHYQDTGKRLTLLEVVGGHCDALKRLNGRSWGEAIDGFLTTVAEVKRMELKEAMDEFIEERRLETIPREEGKRPAMSREHHYNTSLWLDEFADTFPGYAVCDLRKEHLATYMKKHAGRSAKTKNERRGVVKMFLRWAVSQDYLAPTHRLFEAGAMKMDTDDDDGEIEVYSSDDLKAMLERASKAPPKAKKGEGQKPDFRHLLPMLALAGLAGLRIREAMRLTFEDVFRRPDHIEVSKTKSKTRSRRLIPVCTALAAWLQPLRDKTGPIWTKSYDMFHIDFAQLRKELEIESKHNGLRHSFISAHLAAHNDENLTAAQAGNSPEMIHSHYKGLLTKKEGEAWFDVQRAHPANIIALPAKQESVSAT